MAILPVQGVTLAGLTAAWQNADTAGDVFSNSGHVVARIKNGSAAEVTVTAHSPVACNFGFTHDVPVAIPAGQEITMGPFAPGRFNDQNGNVSLTYSAAASVQVAIVRHQ